MIRNVNMTFSEGYFYDLLVVWTGFFGILGDSLDVCNYTGVLAYNYIKQHFGIYLMEDIR